MFDDPSECNENNYMSINNFNKIITKKFLLYNIELIHNGH